MIFYSRNPSLGFGSQTGDRHRFGGDPGAIYSLKNRGLQLDPK
jgi:hypothetical protein